MTNPDKACGLAESRPSRASRSKSSCPRGLLLLRKSLRPSHPCWCLRCSRLERVAPRTIAVPRYAPTPARRRPPAPRQFLAAASAGFEAVSSRLAVFAPEAKWGGGARPSMEKQRASSSVEKDRTTPEQGLKFRPAPVLAE